MSNFINRLIDMYYSTPDFMIIGAQKSGTSSLFKYLSNHPDIIPPKNKEVHFFDKIENYSQGINFYREHFPKKTLLKNNKLTFEATPNYLSERYSLKRIHKTFPNIKFIILLRNPIYRTYSHYNMLKRLRHLPVASNSFEKEISYELMNSPKKGRNYLKQGRYAEHIKRWFKCFDREQFLIIKSEDFFNNTFEEMKKIFNFLELPIHEMRQYKIALKGRYSPMSEETKHFLYNYFKPLNEELYDLLKVNYQWGIDY